MIGAKLNGHWLLADLGQPLQVLSFAPHNSGLVTARHVLWREVTGAEIPADMDVYDWLSAEVTSSETPDAVAMLTSHDIGRFMLAEVEAGDLRAAALATVGLTNAERVGHRLPEGDLAYGTINLLVATNAGLTQTAMLEAMTIAAEARTAAIMETGLDIATGRATGTGTDCIAVACPAGSSQFAGLHTPVGEVIGRAVYDAVRAGAEDWVNERGGHA